MRTLLVAALIALPLVAEARGGRKHEDKDQKPDETPKETLDDRIDALPVKASALMYVHYGVDLTNGKEMANAFDVDRAYFTLWADLGQQWDARVTLDVGREAAPIVSVGGDTITGTGDTKLRAFLKYAYFEWKPTDTGLKLRGGSIETPLIGWQDGFLGTRYITKQSSELDAGVPSADFGVSLAGTEADGLVDFNLGIFNGEGYGAPEDDTGFGKAIEGRLAIDPLGPKKKLSLPIFGFVEENFASPGDDATLTYAGGVMFKMPALAADAEYDGKSTGDVHGGGFAVTLLPRIPDVAGLMLRYDQFDPDASKTKDATSHLIVGVTHDFLEQKVKDKRFTRKISGALTYERTAVEGVADASQGIFLRAQAGF